MQEWRETVSPAGLVQQAKMDGIDISEYSVRQLVKSGRYRHDSLVGRS